MSYVCSSVAGDAGEISGGYVVCAITFWSSVLLQTQTKTLISQENSTHNVKEQDLTLPKTFSHPNRASEHVIRNQRL